MFISRKLMVVVVMVGSIHAASADEASDAVQVLSKLWAANIEASYCADLKILKTEFVGDGKMYKMRLIFRLEDGKVEDSVDEAPFRFLEDERLKWGGILHCRYVWSSARGPSSVVGVRCLFGRDCIETTTLTYDPIYKPNAPPKTRRSGRAPEELPAISDPVSYGAVDPANADAVRRALHTLLRLNAAPPFEPPKAPR
jgi:hypothetical protein